MDKLNNARIYKKLLITIVSDKAAVHSTGEKRKRRLSLELLKDLVRSAELRDIARDLSQRSQSGL